MTPPASAASDSAASPRVAGTETAAEWTVVSSRRGKGNRRRPVGPPLLTPTTPRATTTTTTTTAEISALFSRHAEPYRRSKGYAALRDLFASRGGEAFFREQGGPKRTSVAVVVLGLGTLDPAASVAGRRDSAVQLAALGGIVEGIVSAAAAGGSVAVELVFQDPAFTAADGAFLARPELYLPGGVLRAAAAEHIITTPAPAPLPTSRVIPTPDAYPLIGATPARAVVLVGFHLYASVLGEALASATATAGAEDGGGGLPDVYVGTGIETYGLERFAAESEGNGDVANMGEAGGLVWRGARLLHPDAGLFEASSFPDQGRDWGSVFEPTEVFWRKRVEGQEDAAKS